MYNLKNPRDRARYLRATTRRRDSNFSASERIIRSVFNKERKTMIAALPNVGKPNTAEWTKAFKKIWQLSGENAWRYNEETWGRAQRGEITKPKPKALEAMWLHYKQIPAWNQYVNAYISEKGGEKIKGIEDTTKERLRDTLKEGIANDESIPDLAARVSDTYAGFEGGRSTVIARSETIEAFNRGSQAQAKEAGSDLWNIWIAMIDDRTREEHEAIDGKVVPPDEEFECDDGTTWPGDAVNCRCTVGYVLPEEAVTMDRGNSGGGGEEVIAEEAPEVFTDYKDAVNEFNQYYGNLPAEQQQALYDYTGTGHTMVNQYLRGEQVGLLPDNAPPVKMFNQMEEIFKTAPKYEGTVYRGVGTTNKARLDELLALSPGDKIQLPGFTSTSYSKNIAESYIDWLGHGKYRLGYVIENANGLPVQSVQAVLSDQEILLNHNSTFEVINYARSGKNGIIVYLRML